MRRLTPPVINDPQFARQLGENVRQALPEIRLDTTFRTMVSEDMAFMMEQVPGCYMLVGGANPARPVWIFPIIIRNLILMNRP